MMARMMTEFPRVCSVFDAQSFVRTLQALKGGCYVDSGSCQRVSYQSVVVNKRIVCFINALI